MRTIALEEHFATPAFLDGPDRRLKERAEQVGGRFATLVAQLVDIGDGDGRGESRRSGAVADRAWRRTARGRRGEDLRAKHERGARGSRPAPPDAIFSPDGAPDRRSPGRARG